MNRWGIKSWVSFLLLVFAISPHTVCGSENQPDPTAREIERNQTLVIGKVSKDPKKHYQVMKPIADYAAQRMSGLGIRQAKVVFTKDNAMMVSYLRQGKIDWITETPFSAVTFVQKAKAEIILRRWKKGVADYHTVFFARKDSSIHQLQDLRGKTIAFEDPGSTSAFLLPAATMIENGLELILLATPRERPPADMVGYIFANNEVNAPTWVYRHLVDAGAFSNLDWDDNDRMIPPLKGEMKIFYRTDPIDRSLELVRRDLRPEIKDRLKDILLKAHTDPDASKAMKAYKKTTRFDEFDETMSGRLERIKVMSAIIQDELM